MRTVFRDKAVLGKSIVIQLDRARESKRIVFVIDDDIIVAAARRVRYARGADETDAARGSRAMETIESARYRLSITKRLVSFLPALSAFSPCSFIASPYIAARLLSSVSVRVSCGQGEIHLMSSSVDRTAPISTFMDH